MAKQSKPAIRFKGFTDAWEQRKLGEVANLLTGFPFESKKFVREGIKLVRGMNVKRGYLDFSEELCECWSSSQGLENYLLNSGDILIQMDGALIGKSYAKIKENQLPALLVQRVTRVRIQNQISDGSFVYQQIQKGFLTYIKGTKTETAVPHLSLNDIESFEIATPSVDEEKKIGAFFESLDHLITLHQRKYDKLQVLKKAMLEKMFPKNGSSVPEIRFKGFTDAWEQRKLGALCVEFKSGDFISASDIAENEAYPVYGGNGLRGFTNHYNHDGEYALIGRQGALCGNVNYAVGKSYFTEHAVAVRANKTNQTRFLYYLFSTMNLGQYSGQSAQPGLAVGNLVELENVVPSKPEQEKIASFLSSLDNLITLHQRELEKLQNIKKSMLEKMFV